MDIQFLHRQQIDDSRWDACIEHATNGLPYALSWYLDIVAKQRWDALVSADYEWVMPLPYNRKLLGIAQIYQPYFTQQLGVFGKKIVTETVMQAFLTAIPASFRRICLQFNETNPVVAFPDFDYISKPNYILDLNQSYATIYQNYSKGHKYSAKQAIKKGLIVAPLSAADFLEFYLQFPLQFSKKEWTTFSALVQQIVPAVIAHQKGEPMGLWTAEGELCAAALFIRSHQRIIYMCGRSSALGKKRRAMPALLNALIQIHADTPQCFDFEGSSIPPIATFFEGFGAEKRSYTMLKYSNIPFLKYVRP